MELVIRRISTEFVKDFWHQLAVSQILYNFGHNTNNIWYQLTGSLQFTFVNDVTDNLPAGILLLISEAFTDSISMITGDYLASAAEIENLYLLSFLIFFYKLL